MRSERHERPGPVVGIVDGAGRVERLGQEALRQVRGERPERLGPVVGIVDGAGRVERLGQDGAPLCFGQVRGERVGTAIRSFPSSWGVLAVEAAGAGNGAPATAWIAALVVLDGVMLGTWVFIVDAPSGRSHTILGPWRRLPMSSGQVLPWPSPRIQAVVKRELATWSRNPARIQAMTASTVFAVATAALPLVAESTVLLPWMGFLAVVIFAAVTSNPFGEDGTGLWLMMQIPGSVAAEVRGRQLAWSLTAGSMALPLALAGRFICSTSWSRR